MGIFNKKPKVSDPFMGLVPTVCPECKGKFVTCADTEETDCPLCGKHVVKAAKPKVEGKAEPKCELCGNPKEHKRHVLYGNDIDSAVKHTFVPAEPPKEREIKKIDLGDGVEAIEGKFPEGFDPTNPAKLKEFLQGVLREAGALSPDATIESMELVKIPSDKKGMMTGVATINNNRKGEATKAVLKEAAARFKSMESKPVPMIAEPQDPAKALFINCLNQLHKQVHELAPMAADLYSSLECLHMTMKASNPDGMGRAKFKAFELAVAGMMEQMAKFGEEVCSLAEKVERSGVPVPDGSSATVN